MKWGEKVRLVEDLIRENADVTVRDFAELLKELERIEKTTKPISAEGSNLNRKNATRKQSSVNKPGILKPKSMQPRPPPC